MRRLPPKVSRCVYGQFIWVRVYNYICLINAPTVVLLITRLIKNRVADWNGDPWIGLAVRFRFEAKISETDANFFFA